MEHAINYIQKIHTYIHAYIHTSIHTYIHAYMHTYIHAYMHIYIHAYMHAYIHDFALMLLLSCKSSALYGARLTARKIRVTAACGATHRSAVRDGWLLVRPCGWRLPLVHRVNVKRLAAFGTVSMDILRLDHHVSDTTSCVVSQALAERWVGNLG
jgi:hypothetical protein